MTLNPSKSIQSRFLVITLGVVCASTIVLTALMLNNQIGAMNRLNTAVDESSAEINSKLQTDFGALRDSQIAAALDALNRKAMGIANFVAELAPEPLVVFETKLLDSYSEMACSDDEVVACFIIDSNSEIQTAFRNADHPVIKSILAESPDAETEAIAQALEIMPTVKHISVPIEYDGESVGSVSLFVSTLNVEAQGSVIREASTHLIASTQTQMDALHESVSKTSASATRNGLIRATIADIIALSLLTCIIVVLSRSITRPIRKLLDQVAVVAGGNLTVEFSSKSQDEIGQLFHGMGSLVQSLRTLITGVSLASEEVASAAAEISAASEEIATGLEDQSNRTAQVANAMDGMSLTISEVADKSTEASRQAGESGQTAADGGEIVRQTISTMQTINESVSNGAALVQTLGERSQQIGKIVGVINDIADQTNLLALNAAIEAARAGEHGRGFAVVADEVRSLADRTTKATDEIRESIETIQSETSEAVVEMSASTDRVSEGVELATAAGKSLQNIVTSVQQVAQLVESIAAGADQQSGVANNISNNIEEIASVTHEANDSSSQAAQTAGDLAFKAEQLRDMVQKFQLV